MPLPDDFPEKELLEKNEYDSVTEVSEAPDEELLAIDGIGPTKLTRIRERAPHTPSPAESGTGATSATDTNIKADSNVATDAGGNTGAASDPGNDPNTANDTISKDLPPVPSKPGGGNVATQLESDEIRGAQPANQKPGEIAPGVFKNERGTVTVSSGAKDDPDVISPQRSEADRKAEIDRFRRKMNDIFS